MQACASDDRSRPTVWVAVIIAVLTPVLMCACNRGDVPQAVGDTVTVPANTELGELLQAIHTPDLEYHRFNDKYPAVWPEDIKLPPGTFMSRPGPVEPSPGNIPELGTYNHYDMAGLVEMTPDEVVEFFDGELREAGIEPDGRMWPANDLVMTPEQYRITKNYALHDLPRPLMALHVRVSYYSDLGDWTCFQIGCTIQE